MIISIHSFRGGTGKSNTTANLAAAFASQGLRVGVVDTDIQSPGIHVIFGMKEEEIFCTLNTYLWGACLIEDAIYDVSEKLGKEIAGKIFLIPSSIKTSEIARVLRDSYDVGLLNDGYSLLIEELSLDILLIDTHPGLNEETLLSIAISDVLIIVLRPDQQDYLGTSVTVEVARQLDVPELYLLVNKIPSIFDQDAVRARVEEIYGCEVLATFPHSDEMMTLASSGLFLLHYPDHPISVSIALIAKRLAMLKTI